jgi:dienelactone hydrolase
LSEHPVLIPTSTGPLEGIVSEPDGVRRAALLLMQGRGRSGRSGVNAVWTRTARDLSELGVAVLRADYSRSRNSSGSPLRGAAAKARARLRQDVPLRHEIAEWFRQRVGSRELLLVGSCYGARVAIHVAALNPSVSGLFLIAPYILKPGSRWDRLRRRMTGRNRLAGMRIDPAAATDLAHVIERVPVAMVFGEHDVFDPALLRQALGTQADAFELGLIPGLALHPVHSPEVQDAVLERTVRWASSTLAEHAVV